MGAPEDPDQDRPYASYGRRLLGLVLAGCAFTVREAARDAPDLTVAAALVATAILAAGSLVLVRWPPRSGSLRRTLHRLGRRLGIR